MGATPQQIARLTPLIWSLVTRRFAGVPEVQASPDDLFQTGMEGVIRAGGTWDPLKGSFKNYAMLRAKGTIIDYLRATQIGPRFAPLPAPMSMDTPLVEDRRTGDPTLTLHDMLPGTGPDPSDVPDPAGVAQLDEALEAGIRDLTEPQAASFRLRLTGLTLLQIATLEGVTEAAISLRLKKARSVLAPRFRPLLLP